MELKDYFRLIRRQWMLVVASVFIGILASGGISLTQPSTYRSMTQLFVSIQNSGSVQELAQGNSFSQARVQSYVKAAVTPTVLQPAIDRLGLKTTPAELGTRIEVTADLNTVLINISAEDSSPVQAAAVAQAVADSLIVAVDRLEKPSEGGTSPVRLSVITPAVAPTTPSSPNIYLNLILGLVTGLALGLAAAFLRSLLDTKVRGELEVRRITDASILGGVLFDSDASRKPLLTQVPSLSPRAESFRQIRTNLQFAHVGSESKTVLVTSSLPGEGKSTTATNMAIALAQAGQRVALVDADLRRPMVAEYLGLERQLGLTTVLVGSAELNDVLQQWGPDELFILPSGQIPPNPSELLGSIAMQQLVSRLEAAFDAVIVDAPPLLPVTDAAVLSQIVGGVVLVVGSQQIKTADLEKSISALEMVEANLLGVILNKLPSKGPDAYAYSYYTYESKSVEAVEQGRRSSRFPRAQSEQNNFDEIVFDQPQVK